METSPFKRGFQIYRTKAQVQIVPILFDRPINKRILVGPDESILTAYQCGEFPWGIEGFAVIKD